MTGFDVPVHSTPESADFFETAARGALLLRRCLACDQVRGPQVPGCPRCGSEDSEAFEASPQGQLISWTVVHRSPVPGLEGPYVAAIVECEEGPWLLTRLLEPETAMLGAGIPVDLITVRTGEDGEAIVVARPRETTTR